MKIIRDENFMGNTFTTCLGIDWGIRRCNIQGCYETILGAIVCDPDNGVTYGLCERHYNEIYEGTQEESMLITLDFTPVEIAKRIDKKNAMIEQNESLEYSNEWMNNVKNNYS